MDISFHCERCDQHILVEEAAAGMEVDCPNCAAKLRVPQQSVESKAVAIPPAQIGQPRKNIVPIVTICALFVVIAAGGGFLLVQEQKNDRVVRELEQTRAELEDTKAKLDRMNQDDAAAPLYREAMAALSASDQTTAEAKFNDVRSRFPKSSYAEEASKKLSEIQAARKLTADGPALDLEVTELWARRFDDNRLRAQQELDKKVIRVRGSIDSVSEEIVSIYVGKNRFGDVTMSVFLKDAYRSKIANALSALEKGTVVALQGRFNFEHGWLSDAVFVDPQSGRALLANDIVAFANDPTQKAERERAQYEARLRNGELTAYQWWPILKGKSMGEVRSLLGSPGLSYDEDRSWVYFEMAMSPNSGRKERLDIYFRGRIVVGVKSQSMDTPIQDY
jgi:DNA-directed RNA polymerase subunit RPC12/RpoP